MLFLPQRPYCTLGPLAQQITYPNPCVVGDECAVPDADGADGAAGDGAESEAERLLALLERVGLGELAARVGGGDARAGLRVSADWSDTLSLGEQQRLGFARLLHARPRL